MRIHTQFAKNKKKMQHVKKGLGGVENANPSKKL
jgi:hypothetical protein